MLSIEDRVWDGQSASVSSIVGRMLIVGLADLRRVRVSGDGFLDDRNERRLQTHFWFRNAPFPSIDQDNFIENA